MICLCDEAIPSKQLRRPLNVSRFLPESLSFLSLNNTSISSKINMVFSGNL